MCEQWIFSLIFWSKQFGVTRSAQLADSDLEAIARQIKESYPVVQPIKVDIGPESSRLQIRRKNLYALAR